MGDIYHAMLCRINCVSTYLHAGRKRVGLGVGGVGGVPREGRTCCRTSLNECPAQPSRVDLARSGSRDLMLTQEPRLVLYTLVGGWDGTLAVPSTGGCRTQMSGALWENLPEEVVERILLLLPPASVLRLRAVCRRWRILLSSADFLRFSAAATYHHHRYPPRRLPHLCLFDIHFQHQQRPSGSGTTSRISSGSSAGSGTTTKLDLSFVPRTFFEAGSPPYLTSHNGLLCLASGLPEQAFLHELAICVVNPVSREVRALPQVVLPPWLHPRGRHWVLRIIASPGRGFKVMFLLDRQSPCLASTVGLFSSSTGTWSFTSLTWADRLGHTCRFCDELVYTSQDSHLLLYTRRTGTDDGGLSFQWHQIPTPRFVMDRDFCVTRLVRHATTGGLYAVVLSKPIPSSVVVCGIWKWVEDQWHNVTILHPASRKRAWKELDRIAVHVGNQDHVSFDWDSSLLVVDDFIFVTIGTVCNVSSSKAAEELSKRMLLPRLMGFRILPSELGSVGGLQVVLEVDQIVESPPYCAQQPIHLFRPRLDVL